MRDCGRLKSLVAMRKFVGFTLVCASVPWLTGCAALLASLLNENTNSNANSNQNANGNDTADALLFVTGQPIDGFESVFVTVISVDFLAGSGNANGNSNANENSAGGDPITLEPPVTVDLLDPDFSELLACLDEAPVGVFNTLQLQVTNPEFVLPDGSVIPSTDIQLAGNGVLDLDAQGAGFQLFADELNVIEFSLAADGNALQITENANGTFTLGSEVIENTAAGISNPLLIGETAIGSITFLNNINDTVAELTVNVANCSLTIDVTNDTTIFDADGNPIDLQDLANGDLVSISGELAADNSIPAIQIILLE